MHKAGSFFVTRTRITQDFTDIECNYNLDEKSGLRSDKIIRFRGHKSKHRYPETSRLVEYYDDEKDIMLEFLTNNFDVSAIEVAHLYRNRWQIEVFFKWIKQNLTIKKLWGHSENAVNLPLWAAICTYLIVAYVKYQAQKYSVDL